jgi:hypothetical protein
MSRVPVAYVPRHATAGIPGGIWGKEFATLGRAKAAVACAIKTSSLYMRAYEYQGFRIWVHRGRQDIFNDIWIEARIW